MKILTLIAALTLTLCLHHTAAAQDEPRPSGKTRIAILGFTSNNGSSSHIPFIESAIAEQLITNTSCEVIERNSLDGLLRELKLGETGLLMPGTEKKFGEIRGVSHLVYGSIDSYSVRRVGGRPTGGLFDALAERGVEVSMTLTLRITEIPSGKMILNRQVTDKQLNRNNDEGSARVGAVGKICRSVMKDVRKVISSVSGTVIAKRSDYVMINIGSEQGLRIGDQIDIIKAVKFVGTDGREYTENEVIAHGKVIKVDAAMARVAIGKRNGRRFQDDVSLISQIDSNAPIIRVEAD